MAVRILIAGDCNGVGGFRDLNDRVAQVVAKSGAFDLLLCVGNFFGGGADGAEQDLKSWLDSGGKATVPTYFVGVYSDACASSLALLANYPDCGLSYLGTQGVKKLKGLTVAYYDDFQGSEEEVIAMLERSNRLEGEVDLLLTCRWPEGVVPPNQADQALASVRGTQGPRRLACAFRPRYHVSGSAGRFWARVPYANPDLGAGSHVTRFIGLGCVGNKAKQKYLHALGLKPAAAMDREAFLAAPPNTTAFPYAQAPRAAAKRGRGDEEDGQSWRWGEQGGAKRGRAPQREPSMFDKAAIVVNSEKSAFVRNLPYRASEQDVVKFFEPCGGKVVDIRRPRDQNGNYKGYAQVQFATVQEMRRACEEMNEKELMGRPIYVSPAESRSEKQKKESHPIADCWFCLSNPNADVHLVVSVGSECYCALDKGPITEDHVLVVPIDHVPCSMALKDSELAEVSKYFRALTRCFAAKGLDLVMFERYLMLKGREGGNHCHFNAVGIPREATDRLRSGQASKVLDKRIEAGFGEPEFRSKMRDVVGDGEYILLVMPDGESLVHPIMRGERMPYNFLRDEIASALCKPERGDWRECKLAGRAQEEESVARFKAAFGEYDIM